MIKTIIVVRNDDRPGENEIARLQNEKRIFFFCFIYYRAPEFTYMHKSTDERIFFIFFLFFSTSILPAQIMSLWPLENLGGGREGKIKTFFFIKSLLWPYTAVGINNEFTQRLVENLITAKRKSLK